MALPKILKNFTVSLAGINYLGIAAEVELPKIVKKKEDFRGAGMDAPIGIDMGLEKMTASITLGQVDAAVYGLMGMSTAVLIVQGVQEAQGGPTESIVATIGGSIDTTDLGTWKPGDMATFKIEVEVTKYILVVGNVPCVEIDVENGVRIIGAKDQTGAIRRLIGA